MTAAPPAIVGILGGMGPAAGADFTRLFVQACDSLLKARGEVVNDQAFPEHWLVQVPLPDRTTALLEGGATPLPGMLAALRSLAALGARFVAMPCNTAHSWHAELQRNCPEMELLHIVKQTARVLADDRVKEVGLLATLATHRTGLYDSTFDRFGIRCHAPRSDEQAQVMRGILEGVKGGNLRLARECFEDVTRRLVRRHGLSTLVLACTEIPLALRKLRGCPAVRLVDPAEVLARALAQRAYASTGDGVSSIRDPS